MNNYQKAEAWIKEIDDNPDWGHTEIDWEAIDELKELIKKEEHYCWHDLREDSNDLPKENGLYLVILLPPNKEFLFRKIELIVYSDLMGICKEKHWHNGKVGSDDYENYDERVIAWKYIEDFEDE